MNKIILYLFISLFSGVVHSQSFFYNNNDFDSNNSNDYFFYDVITGNCGNTASLYSDRSKYTPDNNTPIKTIKLIFVIVQYSETDPRNFSLDNSTHIQYFNDLVTRVNYLYSNLDIATCGGIISDSKIRFSLEEIVPYIDSYGWNNDNFGFSATASALNGRDYFLNNYPFAREDAVYVFWTESECWYNEAVLGLAECTTGQDANVSASMPPSTNLSSRVVMHMRNYYAGWAAATNGYWCNNYPFLIDCCPLECPYSWRIGGVQLAHELGHFLWFDGIHTNTCNNIMNGSGSGDHNYFTSDQLASFHRALSLLNVRKYVKDCPYSNYPLYVTSDEFWDFDFKIYSDIIIEQGYTLTINCKVILPTQARIIVEKGAKLIIDGGIVTTECENEMWQGIEVQGNSSQHQYTVGGSCAQGTVILQNGAVIENAECGIKTINTNAASPASTTGGIIQADNSTFRNCEKAVEFMRYSNHHPTNNNHKLPNLSYTLNPQESYQQNEAKYCV